MFELGLDQAHGLKRLFLPPEFGCVQMIGVESPPGFAQAVIGVGRSLIARGFDVRWDDPHDLLPGHLPGGYQQDGTRITVAATHHGPDANPGQDQASYSIFSAMPHPTGLPGLYRAMKLAAAKADAAMDERPLTVMWCGPARADDRLRQICETNLTETTQRFLARPVEFINSPTTAGNDRSNSQLPPEIADQQFMERLAALLVRRLEQANPGMAPVAN